MLTIHCKSWRLIRKFKKKQLMANLHCHRCKGSTYIWQLGQGRCNCSVYTLHELDANENFQNKTTNGKSALPPVHRFNIWPTVIGQFEREREWDEIDILWHSLMKKRVQLSCQENIQPTDWWNNTFCQPTGWSNMKAELKLTKALATNMIWQNQRDRFTRLKSAADSGNKMIYQQV